MEGTLRDSYLLWIKQQRSQYADSHRGCDWSSGDSIVDWVFGRTEVSYYEIVEQIVNNPNCTDYVVKIMWDRDIAYLKSLNECIRQMAPTTKQSTINKFFITITTDRQRATPDKLLKFVYQLRDKTKWIKSLTGVIENFREGGEVLHTHLIIETDGIKYGSKVKDKLYALKTLKELIGGSNYIDYVNYDERHEKYIRGDKRNEKLENVQKDREWRELNNIPHLITK